MSNPIQRDMLVEVAFGADLTADPTTWSWTDVSGDVLSQSIAIQRGRADEAGETQPMTTSLTLDNVTGDYTPDNPVGAYYPNVRRGTPLRLSVPSGESYFRVGAPESSRFTTADAAPLDITGDIDVRVDFLIKEIDANNDLMGKYGSAGQRSWFLVVDDNSLLRLWWSEDGTAMKQVASTVPVPTGSRAAYRVTLDVNNGAGGHTLTFYSAPTIDGPWTQFGDPVVGSGTTSIYSSTTQLVVGGVTSFPDTLGKMWAAQVYDGIGGTLVADADFRGLAPGTTAFTDSVGRDWVSSNGAVISDLSTRFIGHVDEWAPSWPVGDVTGDEAPHSVVDITASSVRRRLLQGRKQLQGPIQRYTLAEPATVAYWPMEDGNEATTIASGLSGGAAMSITGTPQLASNDSIFFASGPLPELTQASFSGPVGAYTDTGTTHARCLLHVPAAGENDGGIIMRLLTTGTAALWDLRYSSVGDGGLGIRAYDSEGNEILSDGAAFAVNGKPLVAILELEQDGADVDWKIVTIGYTNAAGLLYSGTLNGRTVGVVRSAQVNPGQILDAVVVGHFTVASAIPSPTPTNALRGHLGELAAERFVRLCAEEGVTSLIYGGVDDDTEAMGVQRPGTLLGALQECADSDLGIFLEDRDVPGLLLRPRVSLYRQDPVLVLDAAVNGIANPFQPVLDDQWIRNDITVTRIDGGSARAVDESSVTAEGRYEDAIDLSLFTDAQTFDQAWWRLHLGTVPGMRYSTITVDFDTAPAEILRDWLSRSVDVGDLIRVQNLPRQHAPDDLDLIIQGYTETISPSRWQVAFNCSPGSPWRVPVLDDPELGRLDSLASTLTSDIDEDDTSVSVTVEAGHAPWIDSATYPSEFPFDVTAGGEVMTVTAISGTSSPQTFTVTRSVNGVVKSHAAGEQVHLAKPVYIAL